MAANKWINRISFRQLLILTFSIGIFILVLGSTLITSYLSSKPVEQNLIKEGKNLTEMFAVQSRPALLYNSHSTAKITGNAIMQFPDIIAVGIFDTKYQPLYTTGNQTNPVVDARSWPNQLTLDFETSDAWNFIAPVFLAVPLANNSDLSTNHKPAKLLGYVRLRVGKQALKQMKNDILHYNFMVSIILAMALLLILLAISRHLLKPIRHLAKLMQKACNGEKNIRAKIEGTSEIITMELAFNSMMNVLETREHDLLDARDLALESARIKSEFAANVSHELRTPLNGTMGMLELLRETGLSYKQTEYIDVAFSSAESLLALIDDVLDFSKIEAGKMQFSKERFSLHEMLDELIVLLGFQAQKKDLDFAYIIAPEIPKILIGDSCRIRQVLINLLSNALKFTVTGAVSVEVNIKSQTTHDYELQFDIKDTGIGICDDAKLKIFNAFSQADNSAIRQYGGTGLGLAITSKLINLMDGQLGVESTVDHGSIFWFTLTLDVDTSPSLPPATSKDIKILIIDDNQLNQRYVQQLLQHLNLGSEIAVSGVNGLSKLRNASEQGNPYHIVIIDEFMLGRHGADLTNLIAIDSTFLDTKIIIMCKKSNANAHNTHKLELIDFLSKPVQFMKLSALINSVPMTSPRSNNKLISATAAQQKLASFDGANILIVEDNRANQKVAMAMLGLLNCKAQVANNGAEALIMIEQNSFDIVLMDCHMPDMDGYEVTAQIRQTEDDNNRIPIIAVTANAQQGEREKCLAVGMNDYLPKPFTLDLLAAKLNHWLFSAEHRAKKLNNTDRKTFPILENTIDLKIYNKLRKNIGHEFTVFLQVVIEDTPDYVHTLKTAVLAHNYSVVADTAHAIKGSAANFGAQKLMDYCDQLEVMGRAEQTNGLDKLLQLITEECHNLTTALERLVKHEHAESNTKDNNNIIETITDHTHLDFSQQRILIVDDDRSTRFAMRKVLEEDGCCVDEVKNAEQALLCCERFMPDLILMDAVMPGMNGFDACLKIQDMPGGNKIPILIVTALHDESSLDQAFTAGAADYISKPINFAVLRKRITRLLQASMLEKHMRKLAYHDVLTGLPNRALFTERLNEIISKQAPGIITAVLFLDLDRFKLVNDSLGHEAGDLLLKIVAERLQGCVRQGDMVSRFGGDEFTIILNNIKNYPNLEVLAEKIYQTLSRPFVFLGKEMHVSASIGISTYPDNGKDIGALLKSADTAMFIAKTQGKHFSFYEHKMEENATRQLNLENDLRGAVKRKEMMIHYQPQEDLITGDIIGVEALLRWNHPTRGIVSPMEFIPIAEDTGQIIELGEWVLNTACTQAKTWLDQGSNIRVAVNIAARQLDEGDLVERVHKILTKTGLPAQYLELEITESAIMMNAEKVINVLEDLKKMGVKLAIDDFGTGYSSLSYLKKFPIDLLKIDRAFVSDITTNKVDADIVSTIINLAHNLNLKVIAEGVEEQDQKEYLASKKCDFIQGYLLGKPMLATELETKFLNNHSAIH